MDNTVKLYTGKSVYRRVLVDRYNCTVESEVHKGLIYALDDNEIDIITSKFAMRIPRKVFEEMQEIVKEYMR